MASQFVTSWHSCTNNQHTDCPCHSTYATLRRVELAAGTLRLTTFLEDLLGPLGRRQARAGNGLSDSIGDKVALLLDRLHLTPSGLVDCRVGGRPTCPWHLASLFEWRANVDVKHGAYDPTGIPRDTHSVPFEDRLLEREISKTRPDDDPYEIVARADLSRLYAADVLAAAERLPDKLQEQFVRDYADTIDITPSKKLRRIWRNLTPGTPSTAAVNRWRYLTALRSELGDKTSAAD